jgi:hypothetical protein
LAFRHVFKDILQIHTTQVLTGCIYVGAQAAFVKGPE